MLRGSAVCIVYAGLAVMACASLSAQEQDQAPAKNAPAPREAVIRLLPDDGPDNESLALKALDRRVTFKFEDVPLSEFVQTLRRELRISVAVDEAAIRDDQDLPRTDTVPKDPRVTLDVSQVTLRSALDLALKPLRLGAAVKHEVLFITTDRLAFSRRFAVYDVTDLVPNRDDDPRRLLSLTSMIIRSTGGESAGPWGQYESDGGKISRLTTDNAELLIVNQTEFVQRQVEQLLHDARKAVDAEEAGEPTLAATRSAIEQRLRRRVSVDFDDMNWRVAVQTIASRIGVPVQFEPTGTSDAPTITCKVENARALILLKRILAPRQLGWTVSDAGLRIVPLEELEKEIVVRVYDVSDLIESKAEGKAEPDFTELIKVLQTTEGTAGKPDRPSPASMAGMRLQSRKVLVVKDTRERQSRIARLINRLRLTQWQLQPQGGLGMGSF